MNCTQRDFFDRLAGKWDESRGQDDKKLGRLIEMAGIHTGDRILDIGCGTGVLLPFLKEAVGEEGSVTGLDFSANMIARAQEKHRRITGISYVVADILEYKPAVPFTRITCLNFYPHVQDKKSFLCRMKSFLAKQGALIIMHDMSRAAVNAIHGQSSVVTEDRLPPVDELAELLAETGFVVETTADTEELYFIRGRKI